MHKIVQENTVCLRPVSFDNAVLHVGRSRLMRLVRFEETRPHLRTKKPTLGVWSKSKWPTTNAEGSCLRCRYMVYKALKTTCVELCKSESSHDLKKAIRMSKTRRFVVDSKSKTSKRANNGDFLNTTGSSVKRLMKSATIWRAENRGQTQRLHHERVMEQCIRKTMLPFLLPCHKFAR